MSELSVVQMYEANCTVAQIPLPDIAKAGLMLLNIVIKSNNFATTFLFKI